MAIAYKPEGGVLDCANLRKTYRGNAVLDGVSLQVPAGRSLVLLGSSGAGKTTLLRIIAGLTSPDAGEVTLDGRVLSSGSVHLPPEQRGVGMVFQALELWANMSVAEHIAFGLPGRPRGWAARRNKTVAQLAEEVGLAPALLRRKPATLSGGEQQRVAIARTLAACPGVILYDEPLANLDPDRRTALRVLIRQLARQHGTTVVYVTHAPEEALEIGDEVLVLADGRVVERGTPQALYQSPRTLAGARALGPVTAIAGLWRDGVVDTHLGVLEPADETNISSSGSCTALLRPEAILVDAGGRAEVHVDDVIVRGRDWAFTGRLEGRLLYGRSRERIEPGEVVRVRAHGPAAILAEALSPQPESPQEVR